MGIGYSYVNLEEHPGGGLELLPLELLLVVVVVVLIVIIASELVLEIIINTTTLRG